jgi:PAS domain-containing protein
LVKTLHRIEVAGNHFAQLVVPFGAEDALRASEERFRSLVQNTSDIISVIEVDGTVSYISPAAERVLGYRPEERVGTNAFDSVHPDDMEQDGGGPSLRVRTGLSSA